MKEFFIKKKLNFFFLFSLFSFPLSHVILGTLASLGYLPINVLLRRLDITSLAVDAAGNVLLVK